MVVICGMMLALDGGQVDAVAPSKAVHELGDADKGAGDDAGAMDQLASKANSKAEFALNKIKTAKELRSKARKVLEAKGKPIPEILQKGALDDVHQRVVDAQEKLNAKFGANAKGDGKMQELESKVQAKKVSVDPVVEKQVVHSNAEAEAAKIQLKAAQKEAATYKEKYKEEKMNEKAVADATKIKEKGVEQKNELDKKMQETENNGKVMELEVKMKEKAKAKMEEQTVAQAPGRGMPVESDADFNHRQIAQEAYNKQVMGYVMSWEKTHGGPDAAAKGAKAAQEQATIKSDLEGFVSHYENQHESIKSDINVVDTPTRK